MAENALIHVEFDGESGAYIHEMTSRIELNVAGGVSLTLDTEDGEPILRLVGQKIKLDIRLPV